MKNKIYAIKKGHQSGVVVDTWEQCKALVDGCKGAIFKGFQAHQEEQAKKFAKHGNYGKHTPKTKAAKTTSSTWDNDKYPCIQRKTYRDPFTGVLYKNRCVMRRGPTTIGKDYKPHIGNSLPWETSGSEESELQILKEARKRI
jgi:hypothetical protein